VPVDPNANRSTLLLMASLQGLVNRNQTELYLDTGDDGNLSAMLVDWQEKYAIAYDFVSTQAALDQYAARANGTIVYDPARPESVNIGTILAGQWGALLAGPDLADWLNRSYGLPILFDYATSDWTTLDAIGAYDRALRELYPSSAATLLAILPPDRWAIRDYLVATRTFVFYLPQGVLASPSDTAATMRILRAAPRGIPILGWFNSPTLTEENAFLQLASREAKVVVGVQNVTNLSVLTALGRTQPHRQIPGPPPVALENKTYVVLAVPDGDNLDFVAGRMRQLWSEPVRGTVPIAWSMNPLLVELAPPLLDSYYDTATSVDRFIAAPSGAGYIYPDYTREGDLPRYVAFSKRYMDAADMDVVWLLNAFPASEIAYTPASLSVYVDGLQPHGIVLD
ncbi:MAG: GxGYxYP domain-containing protein, partial [Thermoplasmata archaeon]